MDTSYIAVVSPAGYVHIHDRIKDGTQTGAFSFLFVCGEWFRRCQIEDLISQCARVAGRPSSAQGRQMGREDAGALWSSGIAENGVSNWPSRTISRVRRQGYHFEIRNSGENPLIDSIPKTSVGKSNKRKGANGTVTIVAFERTATR